MGLFRRLFGGRRPPVEHSEPTRDDAKSDFATPTSMVEDAFDQIMEQVDAPAEAKRRLRPLFVEAHRSGNPRREAEAVETALEGIAWGEVYFREWRDRFEAEGVYPYMWEHHAKALRSGPQTAPSTIEDALTYLRVADMRQLARDLGAKPKRGQPKTRAELVELLSASGAVAEITAAARPRYQAAAAEHMVDREQDKYRLLAHTLSKRAYALRDRQNRAAKAWAKNIRPMRTDCPVEAAYASRFMAGEIDGDPPFFPGDRTGLTLELPD